MFNVIYDVLYLVNPHTVYLVFWLIDHKKICFLGLEAISKKNNFISVSI